MFQPSLERFTRGELNKLPDRFPYYDYGDFTDPEKINAVFPKDEWTAESPVLDVSERRDWQHIFAVDSTSGDRVEVYFERLPGGVAVAWARLVSHGQTLILREACYKDNSDVSSHLYSAGGIRIECTGPLRRWRIAINSIFGEEEVHLSPDDSERAQPKEVHVKMSARMTAMSHPFEIPKRCPPMMLIKMFEKYRGGYTTKVKESISKCCSEMQGFVQATTLYCEIILDGDRKELLMHGCRLKFLGKSDFLRNIRHFTGYAENGTVFHLMEVSPGCIDGYCFSPSFFDRLVCKGRTEQTIGNDETGSSLVLTFEAVTKSATYSHEMLLTVRDAAPVSTLSASPEDDWFIQDIEGELKRDKRPDIHKVYGVTFHLRGKYTLPPVKLQM